MADERAIDYFSPPTPQPPNRAATWSTLVLTLLLPVVFVMFVLLRRHQLSLPDPYNNLYTGWSTACLLALPVLAVADTIVVALAWRRIARSVWILACTVLGLVAFYVIWLVAGLVAFLFP